MGLSFIVKGGFFLVNSSNPERGKLAGDFSGPGRAAGGGRRGKEDLPPGDLLSEAEAGGGGGPGTGFGKPAAGGIFSDEV